MLLALLAAGGGGCATREGVPRPFPVAGNAPGSATAALPEEHLPAAPPAGIDEAASGALSPRPPSDAALAGNGVVRTALEFLGAPYRNGGSDPSGFDCSGLTQFVFTRHSIALPRDVRAQYSRGQAIELSEVQAGDLVFFETVSRGASHVGIALGDGRFVHAPSSRGVVRVEPYTVPYWARRYVGARRMNVTAEVGPATTPQPAHLPGAIARSTR